MPDLSSLNPAERETLSLLAQGHTAKSIANLTGRTPGSRRNDARPPGQGAQRGCAQAGLSDMLVGGFTSQRESGAANRIAVFDFYWRRA